MTSLSPSSTDSKVIVECTDSSSLFETVEPLLAKRLPLRNLNWKSPGRPLRSINSLHVDLTRAKTRTLGVPEEDGKVQRRHQIPGLRKTPYVKIYLLRCDDNETYKATCRKAVREWVKSVSALTEEGYDACEWLILHIVLPETAAASQPRTSSKRNSDGPSDSTDSVSGKSKWGRGSSTVFEKLKADFNSTSKSAADRVAQIRVTKDASKTTALSTGLTQTELDESWEDLVEKLKVSLLASFDARVRQYEEDIRERDSQRTLPGWNFCTFFILKEGLAKGFEDVGLYEDALLGYEELAYNLDVIIREQADGEGDKHGGTLALSTEDLHAKVKDLLVKAGPPNDRNGVHERNRKSMTFQLPGDDFVLDPTSKPYRDLILANNISIFDFRVYIFSRQLTLLLKAARPHDSKGNSDEDYLLLAEICHRATEFIGSGSRTLREDVLRGLEEDHKFSDSKGHFGAVVENMVSSWIYRICMQILTQTSSATLVIPASGIASSSQSENHITGESPNISRSLSAEPRPSLGPGSRRASFVRSASAQLIARSADRLGVSKTGTEELACARAELFLIARRVLQKLGAQQAWQTDWEDLGTLITGSIPDGTEMEEVSLDEGVKSPPDSNSELTPLILTGLEPLQLRVGVSDQDHFLDLFEALTDQAYRHYVAGNRLKSAESMVADIALQKYRKCDFETAANLFRRLSTFYASGSWSSLSGTLLELYANCLKQMDRIEEYLNILIQLLSLYGQTRKTKEFALHGDILVANYVDELLKSSQQLSKRVSIPFHRFFSLPANPIFIYHRNNSDGFLLNLKMCCLLDKDIEIPDGVKLTLKSATDFYAPSIILASAKDIKVKAIPTDLVLSSNVTVSGTYLLDTLSFQIGHLDFTHDLRTGEQLSPPAFEVQGSEDHRPSVTLYPASGALSAKIRPHRTMKLGETLQMELEIDNGWNEIEDCIVRVKPATAGMRLRVNEASILGKEDQDIHIVEDDGSQSVHLAESPAESKLTILVPYSLENPLLVHLEARIEITYRANGYSFTFLTTASMNSTLPISINVQDLFKSDMLISRFTIGSATLVPLRLLDCHIKGNSTIDVKCGMKSPLAMDISPKQPASILYKFTQFPIKPRPAKEEPLLLKAEYSCLDEQALDTLERKFRYDILASPIVKLKGLLLPHFLSIFQSHWTATDLETISMLRAIKPWPYEEFAWNNVLASVDSHIRFQAQRWLSEWHTQNSSIPLIETSVGSRSCRQIAITVQLPTPPAVVTASLQPVGLPSNTSPIGVGQPLPAELSMSFTQKWSSTVNSPLESPIELSYEVATSLDTWIVGGRKRGNISSLPDQEHKVPLLLLPQRPGHLLLPIIEVKCFQTDHNSSIGSPDHRNFSPGSFGLVHKRTEIDCEVDCKTYAKSVLVIPDLRETTIGLEGDGAIRTELLVASKKRGGEGV